MTWKNFRILDNIIGAEHKFVIMKKMERYEILWYTNV